MKKIIDHIRRWNIWRKHCINSPFHKFLVLIGFIKSPTMAFTFLPEELRSSFYNDFTLSTQEERVN